MVAFTDVGVKYPRGRMTLHPSGQVQVGTTGYYQITFGIKLTSITDQNTWDLVINNQSTNVNSRLTPRITEQTKSLTVIVQISQENSLVGLRNTGAASSTVSSSAAGLPCYMTVVKLSY
ncbi:MAG: hypothetical protein A3E80_05040 [Chlamydiae bacterium RIFCSPHIGHO2_12_FULL_49_9]|nr:MAG: hypothetical protein A3E80_05040 [Chlamydiae bacterium RIFCSPHIGHO2_12_FULL_49_9]